MTGPGGPGGGPGGDEVPGGPATGGHAAGGHAAGGHGAGGHAAGGHAAGEHDAGGHGAGHEPLGSARDEAARLVEALSAWASGALGSPGSAFTAAREHLGAESIATGAPECRVCPVCQLIGAVRGVRPEVVEHLLDAAGSLLAAVKTGLETPPPPPRGGRVEHIDVG